MKLNSTWNEYISLTCRQTFFLRIKTPLKSSIFIHNKIVNFPSWMKFYLTNGNEGLRTGAEKRYVHNRRSMHLTSECTSSCITYECHVGLSRVVCCRFQMNEWMNPTVDGWMCSHGECVSCRLIRWKVSRRVVASFV